jgi:serine/threonine-protein kinase
VRRHPSATVAILGTALFLFTLTGWFFWAIAERTAARRAINDDLQEVIQDERRGAWADAKLCQERVKARLNRNTPAELRRQSQQNDADLTMVGRLDSIRLARSPRLLHEINDMAFRDEYRAAFADAGYGSPDDAPELVASRINTSNIKPALLAAIYDWTASGDDKRLVNWLSAIMAGSDPTPHPWIIRARKKIFTGNKSELIALLLDAPTDRTCVRLADTLALRLQDLGGDGISFLKRTFRTHPDDFWTAFDLGMCCAKARQWADLMIYRQVALALRPGDAGIASQIGIALYETDHKEEALEQMKHAADLDSNCWEAQCNFANCLCDLGHFREAISVFEHCFQLPHAPFADASARYSICLDATGQPQAGCARLIEAINIKPSVILTGLAKSTFIDEGYAEQIRTAWGQAIAKRSFDPPDSDGYQDFCAFLGREDEFRTASSKVLSHSGETDNPQLRGDIARGALLLPTDGQRQQLAFDIIDNNLTLDKTKLPSWIPDHFQFNKALAEYRRGNWQNSITALRNGGARVLGPAELFIEAMSRSQLGETDKANRLFRQGVISINWNPSNANTRDSWIYHVLRREAETMLCRHLPDFVAGSYSPTTNEERIAFTGYCHANGLNLAASKLYSEVFSSDSSIEYSHQMDYRLKAARAAALAGCGIGKDSQRLSAAEKRKWRDQARTWLTSDLASLTGTSNTTSGKAATNGQLCTWRTDRDLANVRDASKLQSLDSQERDQWLAFWVDVDSQINATMADQK